VAGWRSRESFAVFILCIVLITGGQRSGDETVAVSRKRFRASLCIPVEIFNTSY
jgi:hypothetical protein